MYPNHACNLFLVRVSWAADAAPWIHPNTPLSGTCRVHSAAQDALRVTRANCGAKRPCRLTRMKLRKTDADTRLGNWDLTQTGADQVQQVH
jgi:hypothetical protein